MGTHRYCCVSEHLLGQPPLRMVIITDWSFSFRGSSPRLSAKQLRIDTALFFTAHKEEILADQHALDRPRERSTHRWLARSIRLSAAEPQRGEATSGAKKWSRANRVGLLLGYQKTNPKQNRARSLYGPFARRNFRPKPGGLEGQSSGRIRLKSGSGGDKALQPRHRRKSIQTRTRHNWPVRAPP